MTTHPPPIGDHLPEPNPGQDHQPEERLEFALGPKASPDGTPLDPVETRRRLESQRWLLEQLAAQHGLEVREVGQHPPSEQVPTARANGIKRTAQPAMDTAADATIEKRNSVSIGKFKRHEDADGRTTEFTLLELASRDRIGDIIKSIAGILKDSIPKGRAAIGLKAGWLKLIALVQHDGDAQSEERDRD